MSENDEERGQGTVTVDLEQREVLLTLTTAGVVLRLTVREAYRMGAAITRAADALSESR